MEPTIGAMWESYRANVLEPSGIVGGVQLRETRRTFYSACGCMLQLLAQLPNHMSEDDAARAMCNMNAEAFEFVQKVLQDEPGY